MSNQPTGIEKNVAKRLGKENYIHFDKPQTFPFRSNEVRWHFFQYNQLKPYIEIGVIRSGVTHSAFPMDDGKATQNSV
jgi:hypothetical protein